MTPPSNRHRPLRIWQWNANGLHFKRNTLQQHIRQLDPESTPDVLLLQETHSEQILTMPGYHAYAIPPSARGEGAGTAQGVSILVKKGITCIEHPPIAASPIEHGVAEIVLGRRKSKESIFVVTAYSNPRHYRQRFRHFFRRLIQLAGSNTVLVGGDFNAPHQAWDYPRTTAKGRSLHDEAADTGFLLLNDTTFHTRIGTSVQRDTNPDLTFHRPAPHCAAAQWSHTGHSLGSDHYILEVLVPTSQAVLSAKRRTQHLTDWDAFRHELEQLDTLDGRDNIQAITEWTQTLQRVKKRTTRAVEVPEQVDSVDSHLAHMLEARQSLQRRWKRYRSSRNLRKKIAQLNREIEKYCATLCRQQWHAVCQQAGGQLHVGRTWHLLRYLLDPAESKTTQRTQLERTIHRGLPRHDPLPAREISPHHPICKASTIWRSRQP